ncbi:hypothetical protein PIB30_058112 [Stylosanthes scabra]|uniref:Uncharacterized protein n=1 Tax=Stylosanthes scabra TaxID=79078 RepID=A0ABU6QKH8_9FABA|nr:hypothetical protein [Stylosanthes scabra]
MTGMICLKSPPNTTTFPPKGKSMLYIGENLMISLKHLSSASRQKNEEKKLEEQERKSLEHSVRAPMPRRPKSLLRAKPSTPRCGHRRLGMAHQPQASQGHSKPTPRRPTQCLGVTKHPEAQV